MTRIGQTRFVKGTSGNPKGRPKAASKSSTSAFDIVMDQTLVVTRNGVACELTVDEALQQRTYQDAIAGARSARRAVLKMIAKREQWLAVHMPRKPRVTFEIVHEYDPPHIDNILLMLGIATADEEADQSVLKPLNALLLKPWVVKAAMARGRRHVIAKNDIDYIRRRTRDPESIVWP